MAIVDAADVVRANLQTILGGDPSIKIVGEASDRRDALDLTARVSLHMVLIDIRMLRLDGLETTKALTARRPGTGHRADDLRVQRCGRSCTSTALAFRSRGWAESPLSP